MLEEHDLRINGYGDLSRQEEHKTLLNRNGWTVECESPREIRHTTGAIATGTAADYVIAGLVAEVDEDELVQHNKAYALDSQTTKVILDEVQQECRKINPMSGMVMPVMFIASKNMLSEYLTFVRALAKKKGKPDGHPQTTVESGTDEK